MLKKMKRNFIPDPKAEMMFSIGKSTPKLVLPVNPNARIVAHVWPSDKPNCKDLRFHTYGTDESIEPELLFKLLRTYSTEVRLREDRLLVQAIVENPLVPLLESKCKDLGMNVRWIQIRL
jgi:hypothetical protein